jgi:hypothetical protein
MPLPPALVSAYQRWRQIELPFRNLETGRRRAPTYDVENDLDHLHSSLCTQIDELMTRARWPQRSAAGEALAVLSHVESQLRDLEVGYEEKQLLLDYIAATRELAEELERLPPRTPDG